MSRPEDLAFVLRCIAETPDVYAKPLASPDESTRLRDDLGVDSIGLVGVFYAVIDALGVEYDESEAKDWVTLGDVVRFVERATREAP